MNIIKEILAFLVDPLVDYPADRNGVIPMTKEAKINAKNLDKYLENDSGAERFGIK